VIASWARYLLFLASQEELADLSWRTWLGPALVATWLAGMGRYWDHPSAGLLQMLGVGSVVYVFLLGPCSGPWSFRSGRGSGWRPADHIVVVP
jgi:hypothetical protein